MTPNRIKDSQTCLCCMCRCGDHKCLQQLASKLPISMQKDLVYQNRTLPEIADKKEHKTQADLYRKTVYRKDYCEFPDLIDHFPLEHARHPDNVKSHSMSGFPLNDSTYRANFIPWSHEEQTLCRGKLHVPDYILNRKSLNEGRGDVPRGPTVGEYNYYCPPHCLGNDTPEKKENCLLGHERQFNLGPPVRRTRPMPEKSPHPFAKYSNYMLDYKGSKMPPKRKPFTRSVEKSQYTMSSKTSYRDAFSCPPEMAQTSPTRESPPDTLTFGDGPMVQESSSMLDYKDPDVGAHKPERRPRHVYHPPTCSMETTTTTGRTYKRWKDLPAMAKPKIPKDEDRFFPQHETDVRRRITTYQEDFDGINSALCPCRIVEKYGPRVLEPNYSYRKSNSLHDMFRVGDISDTRRTFCPHV